MLDMYLKKLAESDQAKSTEDRLLEQLKGMPLEFLSKVASGDLVPKEAENCSWLDSYKGTPLFQQAITLEQNQIQQEMAQNQARLSEPQMSYAEVESTRLQKRVLDLQLAQWKEEQEQVAATPEAAVEQVAQVAQAPVPGDMPKAASGEKDSAFDIKDVLQARAIKHGPAAVGRGTFQSAMGGSPPNASPSVRSTPAQLNGTRVDVKKTASAQEFFLLVDGWGRELARADWEKIAAGMPPAPAIVSAQQRAMMLAGPAAGATRPRTFYGENTGNNVARRQAMGQQQPGYASGAIVPQPPAQARQQLIASMQQQRPVPPAPPPPQMIHPMGNALQMQGMTPPAGSPMARPSPVKYAQAKEAFAAMLAKMAPGLLSAAKGIGSKILSNPMAAQAAMGGIAGAVMAPSGERLKAGLVGAGTGAVQGKLMTMGQHAVTPSLPKVASPLTMEALKAFAKEHPMAATAGIGAALGGAKRLVDPRRDAMTGQQEGAISSLIHGGLGGAGLAAAARLGAQHLGA